MLQTCTYCSDRTALHWQRKALYIACDCVSSRCACTARRHNSYTESPDLPVCTLQSFAWPHCDRKPWSAHRCTRELVAIKFIDRSQDQFDKFAKREMKTTSRLSHPHIARLRNLILTEHELAIVLDFCNSGDLHQLVQYALMPLDVCLCLRCLLNHVRIECIIDRAYVYVYM